MGDLRSKQDWTLVSKQVQERKVTGLSLQQFNPLMLEFTGFAHSKLIDCLMAELTRLKQLHPASTEDPEDEESAEKVQTVAKRNAPKQFLCPITRELMRDPVFAAFDGHSYEKKAIEEYVAKHNKSPVTGCEAAITQIFPNVALKSRIEEHLEGTGETHLM